MEMFHDAHIADMALQSVTLATHSQNVTLKGPKPFSIFYNEKRIASVGWLR